MGSIKSRAREKNLDIIIAGCLCYILHKPSCRVSMTFSKCAGLNLTNVTSILTIGSINQAVTKNSKTII